MSIVFIWFNRASERITDFTKEEALGRPCYEHAYILARGKSICLSDLPSRLSGGKEAKGLLTRRADRLS
ncbi:MAG: hypothetical protein QMD03_09115 [Syntrophales bacterium]|nr:hypothetical protein [Syntrophales bacterium]